MTSFIYTVVLIIVLCLIFFLLIASVTLLVIAQSIYRKTIAIKKLATAVSRIADTIDAIQNKYSDKS